MIDGVVFTGRLLFLGKFGAFVVFGGIMVWTGVVEWSRVFTDVHALAEWFQLRHFLKCTIVVVGSLGLKRTRHLTLFSTLLLMIDHVYRTLQFCDLRAEIIRCVHCKDKGMSLTCIL